MTLFVRGAKSKLVGLLAGSVLLGSGWLDLLKH